jgi:hypothetical protein
VTVIVLGLSATPAEVQARVGIFFAGIVAGCSCADDPTPVDSRTEYCEAVVAIDRASGEADCRLL